MTFNASTRESAQVIQSPTSFEFESSWNTSRDAIIVNSLPNRVRGGAVRNLKGDAVIVDVPRARQIEPRRSATRHQKRVEFYHPCSGGV
jgi:hypothetical protein